MVETSCIGCSFFLFSVLFSLVECLTMDGSRAITRLSGLLVRAGVGRSRRVV